MNPIVAIILLIGGYLGWREHKIAEVPPAVKKQITDALTVMWARYNQLHGTNYPVPAVNYTDLHLDPNDPDYAYVDPGVDVINLNPDRVLSDTVDCLTDTLPHESAHIVVNILYPPTLQQQQQIVQVRGVPRAQTSYVWIRQVPEHGAEWRAAMVDFGGDPSKDGYAPK